MKFHPFFLPAAILALITWVAPLLGAPMTDEEKSALKKSHDAIAAADLKAPQADLQAWRDARFGMFIHWGLYAIPARGEWVMHNEKIPAAEYAKLADQFDPRHFDADAWARCAKDGGMKYVVLTARHHDGFALWDSPGSFNHYTSFQTASKRDFVAEYTKAIRSAGLKVGIYYSPMDWRFPGYWKPKELPDNAQLMKKQCWDQVRELCSNYGQVDVLWYDGGWLAHHGTDADAAWLWEPLKLNKMVRDLQPHVIISPRSGFEGDFHVDEGSHGVTGKIRDFVWEKCCNLNKPSWGFNHKQNLMSRDEIIVMLTNVAMRGGNLLLNVGPDADGVIPPAHVARLKEVGDWLAINGEAIFGTRAGPLEPLDGVYGTTRKPSRIYVHVLSIPADRKLKMPAMPEKIAGARVLGGGVVKFTQGPDDVTLEFGADVKAAPIAVVELSVQP